MKPEQLLVLASARGIRLDLGRPKREIPLAHRNPPRRRDVSPTGPRRGIPGVLSADGRQDRPHRAPEWTATDLGHAAGGMPERHWRTLCWSIALEEPSRIYLKYELLQMALDEKGRGGWPKEFQRADCMQCGMLRSGKYVEDMCTLALMEVAHPHDFGTDVARAQFFGLAEHSWRRHAARIYKTISAPVANWHVNGLEYLRRRLRDRELELRKDSAEPA